MRNIGLLIGLGLAGVLAWTFLKGGKAQAARKTTPTVTTEGGVTTITPAAGTMLVTPYPGAAPVVPLPVILPDEPIRSPTGQVKVFNPNTMQVAWTDLGNLPNLVAGGWIIMTEGE